MAFIGFALTTLDMYLLAGADIAMHVLSTLRTSIRIAPRFPSVIASRFRSLSRESVIHAIHKSLQACS